MRDKAETGLDLTDGISLDVESDHDIPNLTSRLAIEIPKPKDWQAFQRYCVILFKAELKDPHAKEYGTLGEGQGGIDILGIRHAVGPEQFVGIQCRKTEELTKSKMMSDAREAVGIAAGLKELIFATTAKDTRSRTDAAVEITKTLRAEGLDLQVQVYGWETLQTLIAQHPAAWKAFVPQTPSTRREVVMPNEGVIDEFANKVAAILSEKNVGILSAGEDVVDQAETDEDPALHARIDTYRELLIEDDQPRAAHAGLVRLLDQEELQAKPFAKFRIETNLGAALLDLGEQDAAATHFENAFAVRSSDSKAITNLAAARIIQGRYHEAMELCEEVLAGDDPPRQAVLHMLQAAGRANWEGDPAELVPENIRGSFEADYGLAEYYRRMDDPEWAQKSIVLADRHPEKEQFALIKAIAVLSQAVDRVGHLVGLSGNLDFELLRETATVLKSHAERLVVIEFAHEHDLRAALSNAGVALRMVDRFDDCEQLMKRGLEHVGSDPQLERLLSLCQAARGAYSDAIATLQTDDAENSLLKAELLAELDGADAALHAAQEVDPELLDSRLKMTRLRIIGELAGRGGHAKDLMEVADDIATIDTENLLGTYYRILAEEMQLGDAETADQQFVALSQAVDLDTDAVLVASIGRQLCNRECYDSAVDMLESIVDVERESPLLNVYLEALAGARRDEKFDTLLGQVFESASASVGMLWLVAAHRWNQGDVKQSLATVKRILSVEPKHPRARLLKVECYLRLNRSSEAADALSDRIEELDWVDPNDKLRVVRLLAGLGYPERAADFAYRIFIQHRDLGAAWLTLCTLVIFDGRGGQTDAARLLMPKVNLHAAVDLKLENGENLFLIVEPDADLRKLDEHSWEPENPTVQSIMDKKEGEKFTLANGEQGSVISVRHKYVSRLHYITRNFEKRFPSLPGFYQIDVAPQTDGGFDELIEQLRARHDHVQDSLLTYSKSMSMLGALALSIGTDEIDAAVAVAESGYKLKVATGRDEHRNDANVSIEENQARGCVMDLQTFWVAWRLGALDVVGEVCGPIVVPRSLVDHLHARGERLNFASEDGHKSMAYASGKIVFREVPTDVVNRELDDVTSALSWIEQNADTAPVVIGNDLPEEVRADLLSTPEGMLDASLIAAKRGLLLLSDDLPTRRIHENLGQNHSAWLHRVLDFATSKGLLARETFVRWSAHLHNAGHDYLGVKGTDLALAVKIDASDGKVPGYCLRNLSVAIGGASAEPKSHIVAVVQAIELIWRDPDLFSVRESATGHLFGRIIHQRGHDFREILSAVGLRCRNNRYLFDYFVGWLVGHFLYEGFTKR